MKNKLMLVALATSMIAVNAFGAVDISMPTVKNTGDRDIWVAFTLSSGKSIRKTSYTRFKKGEAITLAESAAGNWLNIQSYKCAKGIPVAFDKEKIKVLSGIHYIEVSATDSGINVQQFRSAKEARQ